MPSGIEVPVSEGTAVEGSVGVDVTVGDGIRIGVAVNTSDDNFSVGEGRGSTVEVNGLKDVSVGEGNRSKVGVNESDAVVAVGDGRGAGVAVSVLEVAVGDGSGRSVGGAPVGVSFAGGVSVGKGGGVLVGGSGWGALTGIHNNRQINNSNRMIATTSLNRSYPGARVDVSMLSLNSFVLFVLRILLPV